MLTRLAKKLDSGCQQRNLGKLRVLAQVSTSEEETKNGASIGAELDELVGVIVNECKHLEFGGLMTIGKEGDLEAFKVDSSHSQLLKQARKDIATKFKLDEDLLELSMGMSADYEAAIREGSTVVRVGSSIFGARDYSKH